MNATGIMYWIAVISLVILKSYLVSTHPFYSMDTVDAGPSVKLDDVSIRRIGVASVASIPTSLWPIPRRRAQPPLSSSSHQANAMPAYNLIWLPGGAVKILPRSMNTSS